MSGPDFGYYFESKEQLLVDLVDPLLDEVDAGLDDGRARIKLFSVPPIPQV